jgi:flagellar export protein FliJ
MRSRESLIRLHRFQVDEKRRKVSEIETMINDFKRKQAELTQQIESEQTKSGVDDVNHYAYPTFAKAAIKRRENLDASINELKRQMEDAKEELGDAYAELKKYELLHEKEEDRKQQERMTREQGELDEVALNIYRREPKSS